MASLRRHQPGEACQRQRLVWEVDLPRCQPQVPDQAQCLPWMASLPRRQPREACQPQLLLWIVDLPRCQPQLPDQAQEESMFIIQDVPQGKPGYMRLFG